ncbi:MAG: type 4a pilus biogenesis protein PilO [Methylophilaceae bacterium]|jgi:type IV pilus assembly protein PilO|nr:type 4a pilus biogenesis protein PilO [Methylophilaceae bacterium]
MKLEDFNNIDFKNAGNLPLPVKGVLLLGLLILLLAAGYWFVWSPAADDLEKARAKEGELRNVFLDKKRQSINLEAYKEQMVEIERTFGALLKQLPDKSQMDGLLTDINQAGLARGLEFELFKPGKEVIGDFYAEMPIQIKVIGGYHDLGAFATDVSKLSRIVTLNDLVVSTAANKAKAGDKGGEEATDASRLVMEAVAKTYRYLDASEIAAKREAELQAKKGAKNAKAAKK